jgi:hypothetical protein
MNDDLVFFKTLSGEDAIRERTRLVQRNLRMVLILVDGIVDVATLKREIGDEAMVDSALDELRRMKLIQAVEAQSPQLATEVLHSSTASDAHQDIAEANDDADQIPVLSEVASGGRLAAAPTSIASSTDVDEPASGFAWQAEIKPENDDRPIVRDDQHRSLANIKQWWQSKKRRRLEDHEEAMFEKAYVETNVIDAPVAARGVTRPVKRKFRVAPLLWTVVIGAAVLGASRLLFYPYDEFRPEFEQRVSRMLDDTVKIGNVRVAFEPRPVILLDHVSIGTDSYAEVATVRLVPLPWAFVTGKLQFQQVVLEGMRIQDSGVPKLGQWFAPASMGDVRIAEVEFTGLSIGLGRGSLSGLTGAAQLDDQHGLARIVLRAKEGDFVAEATPTPAGLNVSATASNWKTPFQPTLAVTKFEAKGTLSPGRFVLDKLEVLAYDGQVSGNGVIAWDRDSSMTMNLSFQHLAAGQLLPALGAQPLLEGDASGKWVVAAGAPSINQLNDTLRFDGTYRITRGNLKRIGLADALREGAQGGAPVRGGNTAFEDFSGTVAVDSRSVRLGGLRLASGLLQAGGQAVISRPSGMITGGAVIEMRSSSGSLRAPVTISGGIADPELKMVR